MRAHLSHVERLCGLEVQRAESRIQPLWQESTKGEHRLPVAAAVAVAIFLQITLPNNLTFHPTWLLPVLESALLIGLVAANPRRIDRESRLLRAVSLVLIAVISIDNVWSAGHLIRGLVRGTMGSTAGPLLAAGASIYITNIIVFGLWYWEFDRGGPVARMKGGKRYPDFLFPQMSTEGVAPPDWRPTFIDYLYISFTNATAFSPTDVLPLSRWAKTLMAVQAGVSLATVALVVARAVNILK
ncbi:MAG: hypothetical protein M3083_16040 [Actinomycetota bacterium]|nr:hypothetical protein [Actinomycetota bacterium]